MAKKKQPITCTLSCDGFKYPSPEFWEHANAACVRLNTEMMRIALDHMGLKGETRRAVIEELNGVAPWAKSRWPEEVNPNETDICETH